MELSESILTSIKKLLGPEEEETHFDPDLVIHINSVFSDLRQMGVGPSEGFAITDATAVWSDFIPEANLPKFASVKSYVYFRVKLMFDPPMNSSHLASIERQIREFEWRLNHTAETIEVEEEIQNG